MDSQTRELLRTVAASLQEASVRVLQLETRLVEVETEKLQSGIKPEPREPERLMTIAQVAELLAIGETKVRELIAAGHIHGARLNGPLRVSRREYDRYVEECQRAG